jgi:hypothetical protein
MTPRRDYEYYNGKPDYSKLTYEDVIWDEGTLAIYKLGMKRVLDVYKKTSSLNESEMVKAKMELNKMLEDK